MADRLPEIRSLLEIALETHGYTVLEAATVAEVLHSLAEHPGPIHLLIIGVSLPGLNGAIGPGLFVSMRPGMRVLHTSGDHYGWLVASGILDPSDAFLAKPFTITNFLVKVRELLDS